MNSNITLLENFLEKDLQRLNVKSSIDQKSLFWLDSNSHILMDFVFKGKILFIDKKYCENLSNLFGIDFCFFSNHLKNVMKKKYSNFNFKIDTNHNLTKESIDHLSNSELLSNFQIQEKLSFCKSYVNEKKVVTLDLKTEKKNSKINLLIDKLINFLQCLKN
jgi:hypothetical protein